jgi:hypothetical protein
VFLVAFSAPEPQARLDYQLADLEDAGPALPSARLVGEAAAPRAASSGGPQWRLAIDTSILADSNVTNSTDERSISMFQGDLLLPVPLDPSLRAHGSIGLGVAVAGGVDLPLAEGALLALDAEGYVLDHEGGANDDVSLLVAAGPRFAWSGGEASVQLLAFDRWYGGLSASAGLGFRSHIKQQVAPGENIVLAIDARTFESEYGEAFGGSHGGVYLSYDKVLDPVTTGSIGAFARRDWLDAEAYSSAEFGIYAGLSRYLGPAFTGSLSGGVSTILFDAAVPFLSLDPRRDVRLHASASLTTRKAIGWGVYPSLSYTYNWTGSSVGFFDARRHRLRFGLWRKF